MNDMIIRRIRTALPRYAYRFSDEQQLQDRIAAVLEREKIPFVRERAIGDDRFDFFCDGVVIEVKVAGSMNVALRQADRYCAQDEVSCVVLVSSRRWQGRMPGGSVKLRGKDVYLIEVGGRAF